MREQRYDLLIVGMPVRSPLNGSHGNWRKASRSRKHDRKVAGDALHYDRAKWRGKLPDPLHVKLTRIAPRRLDSDNLAAGFKAIRDGVADALDLPTHDADGPIVWSYGQERGQPREYAVRIEMELMA